MGLYDLALDCGISAEFFWNSSPYEIFDRMESEKRRRREERKEKVLDLFLLARVIGQTLFPPKNRKEPPHPWDYYPDLFEKEKADYEKAQTAGEVEKVREQRRAYAKRFNERFRQNGNGS